ncbi:MAG: sugar ABC transporter permease [Lachnospiraceae bacterium]|nr:sugar ABC transporter permease [Lachnospiraceae bacterium]
MEERMKKIYCSLKDFAFILPSLAGVSIFVFVPFADVVKRSFTNVAGEMFVGFQNYKTVFENEAFHLAMKNTIRFILICVPLLLISSLVLANIVYFGTAKFYKNVCLLPMAVPVVSLVFVWKMVFHRNGLINSCLGIGTDWLNSSYAFWVLAATFLWKNMGYYVVLWLAGLNGIPQSLYEAAAVDGAGSGRVLWHITLPGLKPMFSATLILAITGSLKSYRECYLLAGEYPDKSIYMIQHLFHNWFRDMSVEKMSASAVMVVCVFTVIVYPFLGNCET